MDESGIAIDPAADRQIRIVMTEYAFEPATVSVFAGETVQLILVNEGFLVHEFRLANEHSVEEHIASGHADHGEGEADHHDAPIVEVPAGSAASLTVTLEADTEFDLITCLIPGHYENGMVGDLSVI